MRVISSDVLAEMRKLVGVQEVPLGSNLGPKVNEIKASTWLNPKLAWPWCQATVNYCWEQATGKTFPYRTAAVEGFWWFAGQEQKQFERFRRGEKTPRLGDAACLSADGKNFTHVTLFAGWDQRTNTIQGLGGNQNDRVQQSVYPVNRVWGYVRFLDPDAEVIKTKPPRFEVVVSDGEKERIIFAGSKFEAGQRAKEKMIYWLNKGKAIEVRREVAP